MIRRSSRTIRQPNASCAFAAHLGRFAESRSEFGAAAYIALDALWSCCAGIAVTQPKQFAGLAGRALTRANGSSRIFKLKQNLGLPTYMVGSSRQSPDCMQNGGHMLLTFRLFG
jgi:hypothetical protein